MTIDDRDMIEDTFLALGIAFTTALGPRTGIICLSYAYAPLDEALSRAVTDVFPPFLRPRAWLPVPMMGTLNTQMVHHGMGSRARAAGVTLHLDVLKGRTIISGLKALSRP